MPVELPAQGASVRRTTSRALDLSAAGLTFARLAVEALGKSEEGPDSELHAEIRQAGARLISAISTLPDLSSEQRCVAGEIVDQLTAMSGGDAGQ